VADADLVRFLDALATPPLSTSGDQGLLPFAFLLGSEASLRAMLTAIVDPDQRNFVLSR
jgi:hypothetical protein